MARDLKIISKYCSDKIRKIQMKVIKVKRKYMKLYESPYLFRVGNMRPTTAWVMLAQEQEQIIRFYLGTHLIIKFGLVLYYI